MSERMQNHESDMEGAVAAAAAEGAEGAEAVISEAAASVDKSAAPLADSEASTAGTGTTDPAQALQAELEAERARNADLLDKYQRSAAEFQNTRRRLEKQMAEGVERAADHVVKRLLPVLDDFDLAFQSIPASLGDDQAAWVGGFRQVQKKLLDLLKDQGVTPMDGSGPFDPNRHEAVTSEPSESVESGHIIATLRAGYESNGRVLRPALVRVAA